jgi:hypothetical protein
MLFDSKQQLTLKTNHSKDVKKNFEEQTKLFLILKQSTWERDKKKSVKYLSLHIPGALEPEPSEAKESSSLFKTKLCTMSKQGRKQ